MYFWPEAYNNGSDCLQSQHTVIATAGFALAKPSHCNNEASASLYRGGRRGFCLQNPAPSDPRFKACRLIKVIGTRHHTFFSP